MPKAGRGRASRIAARRLNFAVGAFCGVSARGLPIGKPKNAPTAFLCCFGSLPLFPTARFCSSSCGSLPLKARDEHNETLRVPRCRCREQRGRAIDAGGNILGFPFLVRRLASMLRLCLPRSVAFTPEQTFPAPQEIALAPFGSCAVLACLGWSTQKSVFPLSLFALHRLFTSSLLGSITVDFSSYPQVGLCVLKCSVCSCVPRARSLYIEPLKATNSTGKATNSTGKATKK